MPYLPDVVKENYHNVIKIEKKITKLELKVEKLENKQFSIKVILILIALLYYTEWFMPIFIYHFM